MAPVLCVDENQAQILRSTVHCVWPTGPAVDVIILVFVWAQLAPDLNMLGSVPL